MECNNSFDTGCKCGGICLTSHGCCDCRENHDIEYLINKFEILTINYEIPINRKSDWLWLNRNIGIKNNDKNSIIEVKNLLHAIILKKGKTIITINS